MTLKVPERTQRQRVSENTPHLHVLANQQVSEVTPLNVLEGTQKASEKPIQAACPVTVAESTQYTILGLPIVHLSLALENPSWIQLSQRGILPLAETVCQTTQTFAGRISLFRSNWKALTQEPWVIQTVLEGYHIPLLSAPLQQSPPCNPHMFTEDAATLEEEIQSLLQKQAICQTSVPTEGFYLNMFIVPKKDGGQRPVINLKHLNKSVKSEHFKMEGLHTVKALLRRSD